ncbi:MAG: hypothetical protein CSYNP_01594 [Syntrophus sp. SKADARSKE-3]|nr:hypothetical protein [Syntrophus sp. SKADARSKE-3]
MAKRVTAKRAKAPVTPKATTQVVSAASRAKYTFQSAHTAWRIINQHLPNPDRVLRKRGSSIQVYRDLLSDGHLTACLESRESVTLSHDWRINRNGAPARLFKAVEDWFFNIIERKVMVGDLSRDELTSNILDVIFWGYQPAELSWDLNMGHWVPVSIIPKPPEWFQWFIDENGNPELRFMSINHMVDGEPPPDPWTLICPRVKPTYDNPYGRGVAGRCFWPIVFKRAGMEFWLSFMERFGTPWVKGTITGGTAGKPELDEFNLKLQGLIRDAVIAVSGTHNVEILESKNSAKTSEGFEQLCSFMDAQNSKTILGHTLSTDVGDKGSYAATRGAMTVRSDFIKRDVLMVKSIFNDIVNLICLRNGYYNTPRPNVFPYHAEAVDTERATRDEALTRAGVNFTKSYFIRTYNLEDDDIESVTDASQLQATKPKDVKKDNVLNMDDEKKKLAEAKK